MVANWPPDVGYAWWLMERFWCEIAAMCQARGSRCYVAYPGNGEIPRTVLNSGIEPVFVDFSPGTPTSVRKRMAALSSLDVRTLYLTDHPFRAPRYLAYRTAGVRNIVVHDHTPGDRPPTKGLGGALKSGANRLRPLTADLWICISPLMRERALGNARIPSQRCFVVQNGIEPLDRSKARRESARRELGLTDGDVGIAMVARATAYKRVDFFLRVAASVRRAASRRVVFFHFGDGPEMVDLLEQRSALGLSESDFRFEGNRPDVRSLLPGLDIAIHPSRGEGFSLAILEYMSAGLATLLPDIPSVCQAIEHGRSGLVYADGDSEAAARELRRLIADEELRVRLGENAASLVVERYSNDRMLQSFRSAVGGFLP